MTIYDRRPLRCAFGILFIAQVSSHLPHLGQANTCARTTVCQFHDSYLVVVRVGGHLHVRSVRRTKKQLLPANSSGTEKHIGKTEAESHAEAKSEKEVFGDDLVS